MLLLLLLLAVNASYLRATRRRPPRIWPSQTTSARQRSLAYCAPPASNDERAFFRPHTHTRARAQIDAGSRTALARHADARNSHAYKSARGEKCARARARRRVNYATTTTTTTTSGGRACDLVFFLLLVYWRRAFLKHIQQLCLPTSEERAADYGHTLAAVGMQPFVASTAPKSERRARNK